MELAPIFKKAYWTLAFFGLLYVLAIFSLTFPATQRSTLYMHQINPSAYQDVNDAEYFGFSKSQVQPFNIVTPDNETLHAWHVLPLHLCGDYEEDSLANPHREPAADVTQTKAFKLLAESPNARVVINFHGNAAHLGSGDRPKVYRNMLSISTPSDPVHLIAFDYRGFGRSTGTPTEEGLITDAEAIVSYLSSPPLSILHSRIVLTGESLGTAVAAGVAERLAFKMETTSTGASEKRQTSSEPFAGIFLFAPFRSLPHVLASYSFLGILPPLLSPLVAYPRVQNYVLDHIVDKWDTASRLARLTGIIPTAADEKTAPSSRAHQSFDVTIFHAFNDRSIPWPEGKRTWDAATGSFDGSELGALVSDRASGDGASELKVWERATPDGKGIRRVTWQRVKYGGHNEIASLPYAALAVKKAFDRNAQ